MVAYARSASAPRNTSGPRPHGAGPQGVDGDHRGEVAQLQRQDALQVSVGGCEVQHLEWHRDHEHGQGDTLARGSARSVPEWRLPNQTSMTTPASSTAAAAWWEGAVGLVATRSQNEL